MGCARKDHISGEVDWQAKSYTVTGSGTHTLRWRYIKDGYATSGSDCGWVDYVQTPVPADWQTITYTYDPSGRRIAKSYDGQIVAKYLYDGPSLIAEYDGFNTLLRKYIYGPGIDQPICMIDVQHSNATYYYHFDGLGSVVALTDSSGQTAEVYEYSIFGEVSASDPTNPNPFLFTGREFDKETGLYYYRARYYNPYIGRFLQEDPAKDGMNWYAYCGNNPLTRSDPFGLVAYICEPNEVWISYQFEGDDTVNGLIIHSFSEFKVWMEYMSTLQWADAVEQIRWFEWIGHGIDRYQPCLLIGADYILPGAHPDVTRWRTEPDPHAYWLEDYAGLLQGIFAKDARIEIEVCYSAYHTESEDITNGIAFDWKYILPDASVWGYTGKCVPIPFRWETCAYLLSEWVEVGAE